MVRSGEIGKTVDLRYGPWREIMDVEGKGGAYSVRVYIQAFGNFGKRGGECQLFGMICVNYPTFVDGHHFYWPSQQFTYAGHGWQNGFTTPSYIGFNHFLREVLAREHFKITF